MQGKITTDQFLAHIAEDGREQTVLDHLEGTALLASSFASDFGAGELGRFVGLTHDMGKYSDAFQRRIRGDQSQVDHSTAGAIECARRRQPYAGFAVAGHHSGLPDGGSRGDDPHDSTYLARIRREVPPYDVWAQELSLPDIDTEVLPNQSAGMFFTRMLYSCLVDADFLDTERFMDNGQTFRDGGDSIEELNSRLSKYIAPWYPPKTMLNKQRCAILQQCLKKGEEEPPGLFTLTVPTGGGKTVASLAFALRHAKAHGLKRVIYVIPYTSIIEQNAKVFRDILGDDNVLEHHSGVTYERTDTVHHQDLRLMKATENWDMPVVVTTAVQFFESLFSAHASQCRKLHNLAKSVIIFDEAQMLPVPYLRPCVFAMSQLVKRYGASVVLCTATQPSLGPLFQEFLPEQAPGRELCPPGIYEEQVFKRVTFQQTETRLNDAAIAEWMMQQRQVLCIVNTRKAAQTIYAMLQSNTSYHLSTLMCPAHRTQVLDEIKHRLKADLPCRVVSTSLVEAGVDVDFPTVFREEAGLDSILQAAGRCNREGKRTAQESVVTIIKSENKPPPLLLKNIDAGRQALANHDAPDERQTITRYFNDLLALTGQEGQDKKGILSLMEDARLFMPFRAVEDRFRLIESDTKTVYLPWGDGQELVNILSAGYRSRSLFRKLGKYSVSIYRHHFDALRDIGALSIMEDGSAILADLSLYSENTGLTMSPQSGDAIIL